MKPLVHVKHEHGFTLIEIIASIAILVVIIAVLLPIFPQILNWTNQSSESLAATHLLDQVIYDLKHDSSMDPETIEHISLEYTVDGTTYIPKISVSQTDQERRLGLYRTYIEIYTSGDGEPIVDTYTYLMGEGY